MRGRVTLVRPLLSTAGESAAASTGVSTRGAAMWTACIPRGRRTTAWRASSATWSATTYTINAISFARVAQLIAGGGLSGQTTEIKIHADHMVKTREKLNKILSEKTGQPLEVINRDTERDHYMTAEEALKYGLIDGIMEKRK